MRKNKSGKCPGCGEKLLKPWRDARCRPCANKFRIVPQKERFWDKIKKTSTCWLWVAKARHTWGYGFFDRMYAHRFSWKIHFGEIPPGMFVCHKCDIPACVRPSHLFLGTNADNMRDKVLKNRHPVGIQIKNHKLTEDQVREIRSLYIPNKFGCIKISKIFNINPENVRCIVHRKTWKHI